MRRGHSGRSIRRAPTENRGIALFQNSLVRRVYSRIVHDGNDDADQHDDRRAKRCGKIGSGFAEPEDTTGHRPQGGQDHPHDDKPVKARDQRPAVPSCLQQPPDQRRDRQSAKDPDRPHAFAKDQGTDQDRGDRGKEVIDAAADHRQARSEIEQRGSGEYR